MRKLFAGLGLSFLILIMTFICTLFLTNDLNLAEDFLSLPQNKSVAANPTKTSEEIYQEANYTVIVIAAAGTTIYSGSGIILELPKYGVCVLTAEHILSHRGVSEIHVLFKYPEFEQKMELIGYAEKYDAALLKFQDADFQPDCLAIIGQSSRLQAGSQISGVGSSPFGRFWFTAGHLYDKPGPPPSSLSEYWERSKIKSPTVMMTDMAVVRGFSGGPALNSHGELVGMMTSYIPIDSAFSNGRISLISPIEEILKDKFVKPE